MIQLNNIEKLYRTDSIETLALTNINLKVSKGEFLSIMGPSGSGKSTLLNIIGLLDKPSEGEILLDGEKLNSFRDRKLARIRNHKIGFVFQSYHLVNDLSVVDNVEIPLIYRTMSGKERRRRALEALEKVGLNARTKHFPAQLSGGQRQRVAIARAIVGNPEIILADEPTGNLDSVMGQEILEILKSLVSDMGTTIVMVTHDDSIAMKTDRIVRLFDGSQVN
ncbi:MAG: ABC transporter ATP-binding protein [Candidatus Marinimicrobia bacterium]|jgi:putative ABC transport system ATP-binding protein|nr:ABC transporter ATP-binding protein [Candidatus Neomarinimicrobiota bacterium]MBT4362702.1 ABC transporter ATP-binding protein [Candidatus Neomarinimicrobiota bacterium]MBT4713289.1 ABC transporter ATP-binding protein [Candidatus Neomarinimicrobiota bacterium]MBT4944809.1 ABC transporter ATP-binding protein [Candidatus Neomarinimicrobiota bacterium]MBT5271646.1 ABC transporter ATP-binding protein [Candidatus Neomarinimicrobiota bacterium]